MQQPTHSSSAAGSKMYPRESSVIPTSDRRERQEESLRGARRIRLPALCHSDQRPKGAVWRNP